MTDELKPCPFCGSSNTTLDYYEISCPQELGTIVVCNDCGAYAKSIVDWNTRPIEDALRAQLAEAKADLSNTREAWNECENTLAEAKARLAWIPVSEPPTNYRDETGEFIPFLVCENDGDYPFRAIYDGVNWGDGIFKADITYWMPLPEGPKEDE